MNELSCCGAKCKECACYGNICKGCNELKGKVFHVPDGKVCPIYDCAINKKSSKIAASVKIFHVLFGKRLETQVLQMNNSRQVLIIE